VRARNAAGPAPSANADRRYLVFLKHHALRAALGLALLACCIAVPAAAVSRTWVSGTGDDTFPCSRTAPCKTFAGALSKTDDGGEISVLDPGAYGAVTINKSVTINGDGTLASILAASTNGIIVNAQASAKVVIRNISINGVGSGLNGVRYVAAGQLTLDHVSIGGIQSGVSSRCIDVAVSANAKLVVRSSTITNCEEGIRLASSGGTLQATLDDVVIQNCDTHAVEVATGSTTVNITHSDLSHNFNAGVRVAINGGVANVEDTLLGFNNAGVNAAVAGALIRVSNSTIVNNVTGITFAAGATVASAGNNRVDGNGSSLAPNGTFNVQ
jgi:hypothetical protein